MWLHIDAAYAGSAMVCPELRWAFDGVERADSVVVNPHKWLLVTQGSSALWTRRPEAFRDVFSLVPEYLRTPDEVVSFSEYGPELGRSFRALKLWAVLRCYGAEGLRERIRACGLELTFGLANYDDSYDYFIGRQLRLTPAERVRDMAETAATMLELREQMRASAA